MRISGRKQVFVVSQAGQRRNSTWRSTFLALLPLLARLAMTCFVVAVTGYRAYTFWVLVQLEVEEVASPVTVFLFLLCVTGLVALYVLISPDSNDEKSTDSDKEREASLSWPWCSACTALRPPDASHCLWCRDCSRNSFFHRFFEYRCITSFNMKPFLVWIIGDALSLLGAMGTLNYYDIYAILCNIFAFIRSLWFRNTYKKKNLIIECKSYPKEAFKFMQSFPGCSRRKSSLFSYYPKTGGFSTLFSPAAGEDSGCELPKRGRVVSCPRPKCNTIANLFWLTGGKDHIVVCNICSAVFTLPPEEANLYPNRAEMAQPDGSWLAAEGAPIARLVFVVDSPAAWECGGLIRLWVKKHRPPIDIDVLTILESRVTEYRRNRLSQKLVVHDICRYMELSSAIDFVSQDLSLRGGKLVFVRESTSPPASTTLVALSRAARRVPLEYVSLAPVDNVTLAPDLNPALLMQIQDGGGRFRWLPTRRSLAKFLQSRDLVPWGVYGTMQVILSPGVRLVRMSGLGVSQVVRERHIQFKIATLTDYTPVSLEVKLDAEKLKDASRLSQAWNSTLFVQMQLTYIDLHGRSLRRVYNRAFTADTRQIH